MRPYPPFAVHRVEPTQAGADARTNREVGGRPIRDLQGQPNAGGELDQHDSVVAERGHLEVELGGLATLADRRGRDHPSPVERERVFGEPLPSRAGTADPSRGEGEGAAARAPFGDETPTAGKVLEIAGSGNVGPFGDHGGRCVDERSYRVERERSRGPGGGRARATVPARREKGSRSQDQVGSLEQERALLRREGRARAEPKGERPRAGGPRRPRPGSRTLGEFRGQKELGERGCGVALERTEHLARALHAARMKHQLDRMTQEGGDAPLYDRGEGTDQVNRSGTRGPGLCPATAVPRQPRGT